MASSETKTLGSSPFDLGAVVFPAQDSLVAQLGISIAEAGTRCLGVIVEDRGRKAKVYFPELDLTLWLDRDEMKDVAAELKLQNLAFANLASAQLRDTHPAWRAQWWIHQLDPVEVLEAQCADMATLWSREDGTLESYFKGSPDTQAFKLSLAIEELDLEAWKSLESQQGGEVLLARFLPAGLHKLEVQIFLKCKNN